MNVIEINPQSLETLNHYVEATIALTMFTFYIVVTLQTHTAFHEKGAKLQRRAAWPILLLWRAVPERMKKFLRRRSEENEQVPPEGSAENEEVPLVASGEGRSSSQ